MFEIVLLVSLSVVTPVSPPQDSAQVRRAAERTAFWYESLLRRRAPSRLGGGSQECDEVIGRFCFRFTGGGEESPEPEEHPDVLEARRRAVAAHRAWFSFEPAEPLAAGPLLRYLVEDGRASEAVAAARTHVWAADRTAASLLLLGMALHEAGRFARAEAVFDSARAGLPTEERERLDDVGVLLAPAERRVYDRLEEAERAAYHSRFWALSDPSFGDGGNERRSAHYARHAWAGILAEAPSAAGMVSWGRDTEEILIRYGRPTSRERIRQPAGRLRTELSMLETFDPDAVSFAPPALLTEGVADVTPPGVRPELERDTVRSSYAPVVLQRTRGLAVQAARFQEEGRGRLLVAGVLSPDTVAEPVAPVGRLVVLDTLGREVVRTAAPVRVDSVGEVAIRGDVLLEPGSYVYRLEFSDDSAGLAGRVQEQVTIPLPTPPGLSDLLIAQPSDSVPTRRSDLEPAADLVFAPGDRLIVWAEAAGLARSAGDARFAVEWWVERARPGPLLGRALRWLGRQIGIGGDDEPVRVRWEDARREQPAPVSFAVDLDGMDPGLYRLALTLTDRVTGRTATAERLFRVDPAAAALRSPR